MTPETINSIQNIGIPFAILIALGMGRMEVGTESGQVGDRTGTSGARALLTG